jgi:hypothetical protein
VLLNQSVNTAADFYQINYDRVAQQYEAVFNVELPSSAEIAFGFSPLLWTAGPSVTPSGVPTSLGPSLGPTTSPITADPTSQPTTEPTTVDPTAQTTTQPTASAQSTATSQPSAPTTADPTLQPTTFHNFSAAGCGRARVAMLLPVAWALCACFRN